MAQEARLLSKSGYRSGIATRRFSGFGDWADALQVDGIQVSVFDPPHFFEEWKWRRLNKFRAKLHSTRLLRRYQPDLVHVAFCWTTYGGSALWLAHHCGIPTVISVHNAFPRDEFSSWHRELLKEAFQSVRGIYAVSESAMQHFLDNFNEYIRPGTLVEVIPNSVDTARFFASEERRIAARLKLGLPQDALVLGSVARLSPQKRPQALISLFSELRRDFPELYLVLVGTGPLEEELRRQVDALGVGKYVIFAGFQPEVEALIPAFDLHLLLSRNEGFGISTIEAMACGVPAVGTDVPGTADILRGSHGGILVPLEDERAALEATANLLRNPGLREEMSRVARKEVDSRYGKEHVEEMILNFYRNLDLGA